VEGHRALQGVNPARLGSRSPYFHNGFAKDLNAVVDFYDQRFTIGFTERESRSRRFPKGSLNRFFLKALS
jgi:cytochrome c peroxidase